jgi:hypothetical protein
VSIEVGSRASGSSSQESENAFHARREDLEDEADGYGIDLTRVAHKNKEVAIFTSTFNLGECDLPVSGWVLLARGLCVLCVLVCLQGPCLQRYSNKEPVVAVSHLSRW